MDVIVVGAHVVGIALEHGFQSCNNLFRASLRRAIVMPKLPGMQVHASFREERCRIQIVGIVLHQITHRIAIIFCGLLKIGLRASGEALSQGVNVCALAGRRFFGQRLSFRNGVMRLLETILAGGIVVVWSDRLRHSPVRHRQRGIKFRCTLK